MPVKFEKLDVVSGVFCSYGCGRVAEYVFKNKKICCSISPNKCPAKENSSTCGGKKEHHRCLKGIAPHNKGKKYDDLYGVDRANKIRNQSKINIKKAHAHLQDPANREKWVKKLKENGGGYRPRSGHTRFGWYKGIWCDSSWELAFVIWCLDLGKNIIRNKIKYPYVYGGVSHTYLPDFIVDGLVVEIKGYWTQQARAKIEQCPLDIFVIDKTNINIFLDYVIGRYGKDFVDLYEGSPYNAKVKKEKPPKIRHTKIKKEKPPKIRHTKIKKEKPPKIKKYCFCGKELSRRAAAFCLYCFKQGMYSRKVERPSLIELRELLELFSYKELGREFNVSDNAIRKWFTSAGEDPPKKMKYEIVKTYIENCLVCGKFLGKYKDSKYCRECWLNNPQKTKYRKYERPDLSILRIDIEKEGWKNISTRIGVPVSTIRSWYIDTGLIPPKVRHS